MKAPFYATEFRPRRWAVYCRTSRCYVLFGTKRRMTRRATKLNSLH